MKRNYMTIEKLLQLPDPLAALEEEEEQRIVNDYVSGVKEWDTKGETRTYIFYCDPCSVPKLVEALQAYKVELSYVTYMGYTDAKISVQRKIDSDFTEIKITDDYIFGRLKTK